MLRPSVHNLLSVTIDLPPIEQPVEEPAGAFSINSRGQFTYDPSVITEYTTGSNSLTAPTNIPYNVVTCDPDILTYAYNQALYELTRTGDMTFWGRTTTGV